MCCVNALKAVESIIFTLPSWITSLWNSKVHMQDLLAAMEFIPWQMWQCSPKCGTLQKIHAVQTCQFEIVATENVFFNLIKLVKVQFISCQHEMWYCIHFLFAMRECILPIINMHYTLLKLWPCFLCNMVYIVSLCHLLTTCKASSIAKNCA